MNIRKNIKKRPYKIKIKKWNTSFNDFVLSHYKKMFTHHMKIYSNDIILHGVIIKRKKCII